MPKTPKYRHQRIYHVEVKCGCNLQSQMTDRSRVNQELCKLLCISVTIASFDTSFVVLLARLGLVAGIRIL